MTGKPNGNGQSVPEKAAESLKRLADSLKKTLPKKFYTAATVSDAPPYRVLLDGRPVKTPKKRDLAFPIRALAVAVAGEWQAQGAEIDPSTMPLTRIANSAIDAVADRLDEVAADIVAYANSDLVCYRASDPQALVHDQQRHWDPVVAWAHEVLGADFIIVTGVMPTPQPPEALAAVSRALLPHEALRLSALHVLTTLTGSALLGLSYEMGAFTADQTWASGNVDEDHQIRLWGEDEEAADRRKRRRLEFDAACRILSELPPRGGNAV